MRSEGESEDRQTDRGQEQKGRKQEKGKRSGENRQEQGGGKKEKGCWLFDVREKGCCYLSITLPFIFRSVRPLDGAEWLIHHCRYIRVQKRNCLSPFP